MWEGWLSTSSNMGRPPLLQDSCKRQTIISSCTNSSKVNSYRWVKGATETYPSYAHTPVVKLVLCLAEETLTERKKPISCGASDLLTFTWNNGLQFEIQKLCTIKKNTAPWHSYRCNGWVQFTDVHATGWVLTMVRLIGDLAIFIGLHCRLSGVWV